MPEGLSPVIVSQDCPAGNTQRKTVLRDQPASVAGFSHAFADADDFSAALLGGTFEYVPMLGQAFAGRLDVLKLGDRVIQVANQGAHTARGAIAEGLTALLLPLRYTDAPARMNGAEVQRSGAFLAPGGVEFHGHVPGDVSWAALALPQAQLEALAELAPLPVRSPSEAGILALPAEAEARLSAAVAAAAAMASAPPAVLFSHDCVEGLAHALDELLCDVLTADSRLIPLPRATREAYRVVRAAEDFLDAHFGRPIYREQLCAALGVSLRKLHDAFTATVGMSPQTYLKTRRLLLARRALRREHGEPALVKAVALSHGFWHFGHFARDYRTLFGESPSQTRGATAAAAPMLRPLTRAP